MKNKIIDIVIVVIVLPTILTIIVGLLSLHFLSKEEYPYHYAVSFVCGKEEGKSNALMGLSYTTKIENWEDINIISEYLQESVNCDVAVINNIMRFPIN